ncbi:NAD(P)-dependent oxidoreductase [Chloroflexi bacterium TSY]|nr:NAD(P)-dependent oxidoreductase [Chloroflexi bacterium TSY]
MPKSIAVTGATGIVGKFVVPELLQQGASVRALARPTSDRRGFSPQVEWVFGDLADPTARQTLVHGVDAVVHLAYQHVPGRYRGGEGDDLAQWLELNLTGTIQLLLATRDAQVAQFIFLSSRAVFSNTEPGRVLDETHPISPDTHYGAYKAAVEALLRSFTHVEGMQTTSVRATGIYGIIWPIERSKWWNLVRDAVMGKPIETIRGGTEVHGQDVARTVWALIDQPATAPEIVHLSDLYVTTREIVALARRYARSQVNDSGSLPPLPQTAPSNILVSTHLDNLGIRLGGQPLLEKTIAELVKSVK